MLLYSIGIYNIRYIMRKKYSNCVVDNIITAVDKQRDHAWTSKGDGFNADDEVKLMMNIMYVDSNIFDDGIEDVR